jgi:hypothetical protein
VERVHTRERALSFGASGGSGDLNPDDGERAGDVIFTIILEVPSKIMEIDHGRDENRGVRWREGWWGKIICIGFPCARLCCTMLIGFLGELIVAKTGTSSVG